jgi:hypothetical protein
MKLFKSTAFALMLTTCSMSPVMAQQNCMPREQAIEFLADEFGEGRIGMGLADNQIVELYTNPDTGTWTIVTSFPNGQTCLLAEGSDYLTVEPEPKGIDG